MSRAREMVLAVVCISTMFAAFSVFGVADQAGVHADPGLHEDIRDVSGDVDRVEADREPGSEWTGGILGSITQILGAYKLLYGLGSSPGNLGLDPRLGLFLGIPVTFIVGFGLYKAVRGGTA